MYNFVGSNEIGKGTTIEEQVGADRFIEIGTNSYVGVNSVLTSHLVDGIFGNISYFKLKVGDNVTLGGWNCFASGTEIHDNSYLMPSAHGGKHYIIKGNNFYFGMPLRKIFKKKIMNYLALTIEDLEVNDRFAKTQQDYKKNINNEEIKGNKKN
jgi:UDP-3-O-[3-hydroxymyristoyl] glucosamine N-acyltransferase